MCDTGRTKKRDLSDDLYSLDEPLLHDSFEFSVTNKLMDFGAEHWQLLKGVGKYLYFGANEKMVIAMGVVSRLFSAPGGEIFLRGGCCNFILFRLDKCTKAEVINKTVIIYEGEFLASTITLSDVNTAMRWKDWIMAYRFNVTLPEEERLATRNGIMNRYKSVWIQVANITRSEKVDYLPKHTTKLIMYYIHK